MSYCYKNHLFYTNFTIQPQNKQYIFNQISQNVGEGCASLKKCGRGIFGVKICGMWDFWGKKMWDVGFFRPKNVGCGILGPPYKPPSLDISSTKV